MGPTESAEALRIGHRLLFLREKHGLRFSDIAILARTRRILSGVEGVLKRLNIPTWSPSHQDSRELQTGLKSKEIEDVLAYLSLMADPDDDEAFSRSPLSTLACHVFLRIPLRRI